jgi:hypothetical protein
MAQLSWRCNRNGGCGFSIGDELLHCRHMADPENYHRISAACIQARSMPQSNYNPGFPNRLQAAAAVAGAVQPPLPMPRQAERTNSPCSQHGQCFSAAGLNDDDQRSGMASIPKNFLIVRGDKAANNLTEAEKKERIAAIFGASDASLMRQHGAKMETLESAARSFIATRALEWKLDNPMHPVFKARHRSFANCRDVLECYEATDCIMFHNAAASIFRDLKASSVCHRMEDALLSEFKCVATGTPQARRGPRQEHFATCSQQLEAVLSTPRIPSALGSQF